MRPEFIPVGRIVNAHGIRGEVKLNPEGCDPGFLTAFDTLYIAGEPVPQVRRPAHAARRDGYGCRPRLEGESRLHPP